MKTLIFLAVAFLLVGLSGEAHLAAKYKEQLKPDPYANLDSSIARIEASCERLDRSTSRIRP